MASIHMTLQGKGGVGKSFVAATIAQYLRDQGRTPRCYDTDPVNRTFAGYEEFGASRVELMVNNDIDPSLFDAVFNQFEHLTDDSPVVIDNGASSFVPLAAYMSNDSVPAMLADRGHTLHLHTVVTGGQGLEDTLRGLETVLTRFAGVPCIIWVNPVHGRVEHGGLAFEQMPAYLDNESQIAALIHIPELHPKTSGRDLSDLLKSRRTFAQAVEDQDLGLMVRQRLKVVQRRLYAQIEAAAIL